MKVEEKKADAGVAVCTLAPGECFMYRNSVWVRTDEVCKEGYRYITRLCDGHHVGIPRLCTVEPVNAKVVIE